MPANSMLSLRPVFGARWDSSRDSFSWLLFYLDRAKVPQLPLQGADRSTTDLNIYIYKYPYVCLL